MDLTYEKDFLKTMIIDFKKLLVFHAEGLYGRAYLQQTYTSVPKQVERTTLSKYGTMMYYYFAVYDEQCPTVAITPPQQERINTIWKAMGMPENVVPV